MSILDSGNRTEFGSGAVRDMQDDKGRCDLMPLDVVESVLNGVSCSSDTVLSRLEDFKKYHRVENLKDALAFFTYELYPDHENTEMCLIDLMLDVSIHFREGAKKYGVDNWKKGIPEWSYLSSAVRHYLKWLRGDKDEHHDRAFVWNIVCLIWTVENKVEVKG